jgi:hypothetical protein
MYRYQATEAFWASFYRLSEQQKESTRRAWQIFKIDPFDPRFAHTRFTDSPRTTAGPSTP